MTEPSESRRAVASFRHMQHAQHAYDNARTDEEKNAAAARYMEAEQEHFAELRAERNMLTARVKRYVAYSILAAFGLGLVIAFILIPVADLQNKTQGITEIGPCRQAFHKRERISDSNRDPECALQAYLNLRSDCYHHFLPRSVCSLRRLRRHAPPEVRATLVPPLARREGVVPRNSGQSGSGQPGGHAPPTIPPAHPPTTNPPPGGGGNPGGGTSGGAVSQAAQAAGQAVGQAAQQVCGTVNGATNGLTNSAC